MTTETYTRQLRKETWNAAPKRPSVHGDGSGWRPGCMVLTAPLPTVITSGTLRYSMVDGRPDTLPSGSVVRVVDSDEHHYLLSVILRG